MGDINAKITISQNSNDKKKEMELSMNETETTSAGAQTGKNENNSERNQGNPPDETGKVDFNLCRCSVVLFILLMGIFIGGIVCSVVFIKNICVPFTDSLNVATCIQLPACVGCKTVVNDSANIATCIQLPACVRCKAVVNNSVNFVACIQYTVSLALVLAAVIIMSISLIKAAKWLIKVDFIRQVLNSSCNAEQKKKFCDTLVEL